MHIEVPQSVDAALYRQGAVAGTELRFRHRGGFVVFELNGSLAMRWVAEELGADVRRMIAGGRRNLILDLGGVTFADSAGIGALVAVRALISKVGGKLVLLCVPRRVREMLKRMRLEPFFAFSDDPQFALQ